MNFTLLLGAFVLTWTAVTAPAYSVQEKPVITTQKSVQVNQNAAALGSKEALALLVESRKNYWHVETGGQLTKEQLSEDGQLKTFEYDGLEYYDIGSDIGTPEKFTAYMEKAFTKEIAKAHLQKKLESKYLINHGDRLAKVNADRGSLLDWERAKVEPVKQSGSEAQFVFQVPIGEDYGCETYNIAFRYVEGAGWRVATDPEAKSIGACQVGKN